MIKQFGRNISRNSCSLDALTIARTYLIRKNIVFKSSAHKNSDE